MILSLFLDIAPPRVRSSTFDPQRATRAHSIPILHRVNVQSTYSRQVTPVLYILCDTHLSSRGSLAGVNKAYVFFQATHVGSLISFGVRTKGKQKDDDVEIHHQSSQFRFSHLLIYTYLDKKAIARKEKPLDDQSKGFKVRGTPNFIERRDKGKTREERDSQRNYNKPDYSCQHICKNYIEIVVYN